MRVSRHAWQTIAMAKHIAWLAPLIANTEPRAVHTIVSNMRRKQFKSIATNGCLANHACGQAEWGVGDNALQTMAGATPRPWLTTMPCKPLRWQRQAIGLQPVRMFCIVHKQLHACPVNKVPGKISWSENIWTSDKHHPVAFSNGYQGSVFPFQTNQWISSNFGKTAPREYDCKRQIEAKLPVQPNYS